MDKFPIQNGLHFASFAKQVWMPVITATAIAAPTEQY